VAYFFGLHCRLAGLIPGPFLRNFHVSAVFVQCILSKATLVLSWADPEYVS